MLKLIIIVAVNLCFTNGYIVDPGPVVIATQGEIWPKPFQQEKFHNKFSIIDPERLEFRVIDERCAIINEAVKRYRRVIRKLVHRVRRGRGPQIVERHNEDYHSDPNFNGNLHVITICLRNNTCEEKPHPNMTESYKLTVKDGAAVLDAETVWGILRGLESFSQMLILLPDRYTLMVHESQVVDKPRYSHRGLLVDTSRHFINVFTIKQILDGMSYNKLNVFHWHIVDDHSFPYVSKTFPDLSKKGRFSTYMEYPQDEVQEIIEYARLRGIRTIAEFDTPGHTRSWGAAYPEILTACEGTYSGKFGPIDPTKNRTYEFMQKLLTEIVSVFPDEYTHLGGDEVGFECWESSSHIRTFMKEKNITTFSALEEYYIQRIVQMVDDLSHKSIVWQEVFENGVQLPPETVVHVWTGDRSRLLDKITKNGFPAILSSCWYLDHLSNGGDWRKYYACEPSDFPGDAHQQSLLIGGEACMWSEAVDNTNILQRIFPRVSAAAEKLWSPAHVNDVKEASERLEEHTCRMRMRGIPAQPPNGPGFCPYVNQFYH